VEEDGACSCPPLVLVPLHDLAALKPRLHQELCYWFPDMPPRHVEADHAGPVMLDPEKRRALAKRPSATPTLLAAMMRGAGGLGRRTILDRSAATRSISLDQSNFLATSHAASRQAGEPTKVPCWNPHDWRRLTQQERAATVLRSAMPALH
jgi:hypothetical protein